MGSKWLWNFTQFPGTRFMTEDDMRFIPYPAVELGIHIAYKTVEAGSLIGGFVVAPLWHQFRKANSLDKRKLIHRVGICGRRGMLIGLVIAPIMEFAFIKKKEVTEDGLFDRCYRIRYNKKQLTIDRAVTVSWIFGFAAMRWSGAVIGTNLAILVGAMYNALLFDRIRSKTGGDQMEKPDENYKPKKL